jgi:hypothetical protein
LHFQMFYWVFKSGHTRTVSNSEFWKWLMAPRSFHCKNLLRNFFLSLLRRIFTWYAILYYEAAVTSFHNLTSLTQTTIFALYNHISSRHTTQLGRSKCPRGLRRESAAARLLGFCIWLSASFERCVLSGRWRCFGQITRTDRGVPECDLEVSIIRSPWPIRGCCTM